MSIKVSVCIPVYGVEKYIERCARSLFEQTMQDGIEFIFVNDCTPDKSIEVLERVLAEYPHRKEQTKIFHHNKNQGLVAARKTGLAHASGKYIIHCDSDDWVDLDFYETMYKAAKDNDADVVYAPYITHTRTKCVKNMLPECKSSEMLLQKILDDRFQWSLINKLFRASIACSPKINCPDHICHSEDLLRCGQSLTLCKNVYLTDNVFYHYFKGNPQAYTRNFSRNALDNIFESISILQKKLPDDCDFNTIYTFALFMGIIYKLFTAEEFSVYSGKISLLRIIKCKQSLAIKVVVCSAKLSYRLTSTLCYCLLMIRKKMYK